MRLLVRLTKELHQTYVDTVGARARKTTEERAAVCHTNMWTQSGNSS